MPEAKRAGAGALRGRFNPYPKYKDSGVEWLGEIPAHWDAKKTTWLFSIGSGTTPPSENPAYYGGDIPWVTTSELRESVVDSTDKSVTKEALRDLPSLVVHPSGSVAVAMYGATIGRLGILGVDAAVNQACCVFSKTKGIDAKYWFFWLQMRRPYLISLGYGGGQPNLSQELLRSLRVTTPPEPEQRAIAAFLDRETARIDALVTKKERLIELLQEKRTALITRAVTKGLDPDVPMKDSGVEWLGEIPGHWEVERIKWAARMESGHTPDKKVESYWMGGDIPWVSLADTGQLREVDYIADTAVMTTSDGIAHSSAHILPAGTVVFSRDATIGLCAITCAGMAVSQHFIGWVCSGRLQPEYLLFFLRSITQELERLTMGATVRTIGMPDVKSLVTPIPPVSEQERIILHVHKNRSEIDALVGKIRDAITHLKELRTALISAAVTGKIDVRHESQPENTGGDQDADST